MTAKATTYYPEPQTAIAPKPASGSAADYATTNTGNKMGGNDGNFKITFPRAAAWGDIPIAAGKYKLEI